MSFRLADLKKTVRKGKNGYIVAPARLDGRAHTFRIEFLLQQFEEYLGRPRRELDPNTLLEFVGDARLGRGLLATLSQWYRVRARTFAEVLDPHQPPEQWRSRFRAHGIETPVDLRACFFAAVNRGGDGFLDPEAESPFWQGQSRALGIRREGLRKLMYLDCPEEAVLVRTGPRPAAADVTSAYNARACTTLLRCAREVTLCSAGPAGPMERAARTWASWLGVEGQSERGSVTLAGRADTLGSWTRHGRRVEQTVLELLAHSDLEIEEIRGRIDVGERECGFVWKRETLVDLGAGGGPPFSGEQPEMGADLPAALRRERERAQEAGWGIRRPSHLIGVAGAVCLPHVELRRGDTSLYLRGAPESVLPLPSLRPFRGKTPLASIAPDGRSPDQWLLSFPGELAPRRCLTEEILRFLDDWLQNQKLLPSSTATDGVRLKAA